MNKTNLDIIFREPENKATYCLVRPQSKITCDIVDVKILKISKLKNGYLLNIFVSHDVQKILDEVDKNTLISLLTNNKEWFNNDLSSEEIKDMFFSSYCAQDNQMNVFLKENVGINLNNKQIDINDFITNISSYKSNLINIKLQLLGLYIYKKQTINKWSINTINVYENTEDISEQSKEEIEEFWKSMLEKSDEVLNTRIQNIELLRENMYNIYSKIVETKNNIEWEKHIVELKKIIQNIIF